MNQQREKKRRKSNLTEGEKKKKKKKKKRCGKKIRNLSDMFVVHLTGINLSFCRVKQIFEASVLDAGKH